MHIKCDMSQQEGITRRDFLKAAVVSGVVLTLSGGPVEPLDLKLLEPVKAKPEEEVLWFHSSCAMCLSCPVKVGVKDGRIVDVRGEDIYPWNGRVCGKALAGIKEKIYGPDRILYPLKRVGERGEAKFVRCSWDEVIDAVAATLKKYIDMGHPEYFEIWWGCPYQVDNMYFLHYWCRITGASISYMHGQTCFGDNAVEKNITFGANHASALMLGNIDLLRTKYAVIAAQNFPGTAMGVSASPSSIWPIYVKAKERGLKVVIIDPRLSDTSCTCDEWIPLKPGTDAALVLGIINILIKEGLYDEDFLLRYTNAPQLIRTDTGEPLKDKEGHYLVWDTKSNSVKPIPPAGEREGLTLGLGNTFKVSIEGKEVEREIKKIIKVGWK